MSEQQEIEQQLLRDADARDAARRAMEAEGDTPLQPATAGLGGEVPSWPSPPNAAAFSGLLGEICQAVEPRTEADLTAILLQMLSAFGNSCGREAYFQVGPDRHRTNIYAVLVGRTSKARKGLARSHVQRLFTEVDGPWAERCIQSGLSSGEGVIWAVRDPITKRERVGGGGGKPRYEDVVVDHGVKDKRLLVIEPEFARVLKVAGREGNILSSVLREAWDTGNLQIMTKATPARAVGAHVSIIGHITLEELRRYLTDTDQANGFANRFLFACVTRSKCLPEAGDLSEQELSSFAQKLREAVDFARGCQEIHRDHEARKAWCEVYPDLSEGNPGLMGAITARAEAQVVRLSMLYALADHSQKVRKDHLLAGLALWEYGEASAKFIFGEALGSPLADEILRLLRTRPEGMTRTDIRDHFGRHRSGTEIGRALGGLAENGLATYRQVETGGRPQEVWRALLGSATKAI